MYLKKKHVFWAPSVLLICVNFNVTGQKNNVPRVNKSNGCSRRRVIQLKKTIFFTSVWRFVFSRSKSMILFGTRPLVLNKMAPSTLLNFVWNFEGFFRVFRQSHGIAGLAGTAWLTRFARVTSLSSKAGRGCVSEPPREQQADEYFDFPQAFLCYYRC